MLWYSAETYWLDETDRSATSGVSGFHMNDVTLRLDNWFWRWKIMIDAHCVLTADQLQGSPESGPYGRMQVRLSHIEHLHPRWCRDSCPPPQGIGPPKGIEVRETLNLVNFQQNFDAKLFFGLFWLQNALILGGNILTWRDGSIRGIRSLRFRNDHRFPTFIFIEFWGLSRE